MSRLSPPSPAAFLTSVSLPNCQRLQRVFIQVTNTWNAHKEDAHSLRVELSQGCMGEIVDVGGPVVFSRHRSDTSAAPQEAAVPFLSAFWFIWQKCTLFNLCETDGMNQHQRFFVYLSTFNQPESCKPSSASSSPGIQLLHQHHQRLDFLFTSLNITSSHWSLYKFLRKRGDKSSCSLKTLRVSLDWNSRMILT